MLIGTWRLSVAAVVVSACISTTQGAWIPGDGSTLVTVTARSGADTATQQILVPLGTVDSEHYDWSLSAPTQLQSDGRLLGTIKSLTLSMDADPGVSLGFLAEAGAADTEFTFTSSTVIFAPINSVLAYASAGVSVTDVNSNGASLVGLFSGDNAYEAYYNSPTITWTGLIPGMVSAAVDTTNTVNERRPPAGREVIADTVSSIQSQWHFRLSAGDQASGTSRFDVIAVPEPATIGLLALAGLLGLRRRRTA